MSRAVLPRRGPRRPGFAAWTLAAALGPAAASALGQPPTAEVEKPPEEPAEDPGLPDRGEENPESDPQASDPGATEPGATEPGASAPEAPAAGEAGEAGQPPSGEGSGETEAAPEEGDEAAGSGEEGAEPGEGSEDELGEGEEEEDLGPRVAGLAGASAGILPGEEMAAPAPDPGSPVVGLVLEEEGFVALTASGRVVAYGPDGGRPRWAVMEDGERRTAAIGRWAGGVPLLGTDGVVEIRAPADGAPAIRFATGERPGPLPGIAAAPDLGTAGAGFPIGVGAAGVARFGPEGLFFASGDRLLGFSAGDGERLFETPLAVSPGAGEDETSADGSDATGGSDAAGVRAVALGGPGERTGPVAAVSLGPGGLALIDAGSGALRWRRDDLGDITAPALVAAEEGLVVAGSREGDLHALRLRDGRTRWRRRLFEGFDRAPFASRGRLYAASEGNSLYCYDLARGGERWRAALPGRPAASPRRVAGALLVAVRDGLLVELNPNTGLVMGRARQLDSEIFGVVRHRPDGPGESGWRQRRVYLGLRDGRLLVLRPRVSLDSGSP